MKALHVYWDNGDVEPSGSCAAALIALRCVLLCHGFSFVYAAMQRRDVGNGGLLLDAGI